MNLRLLARKTEACLRTEGIGETIRRGWSYLCRNLLARRSSFDRRTGLDTDGYWPAWSTRIVDSSLPEGVHYEPTPEALIGEMLDAITDPDNYEFIDLGCGKGRVLCIAAERGFRRLIGVDYGIDLAEIARHNLQRIGAEARSEVICGDAGAFTIPDHCVIYMYNPFGATVMSKVAEHIGRARDVHTIYFSPTPEGLSQLDSVGTRTKQTKEYVIYRRSV